MDLFFPKGSLEPRRHEQKPVTRSVEELILLALFRVLFLIAQSDKAVRLAPTFRLIPEFALFIGVRVARGLPVSGLQLFQQTCRLARHDDEVRLGFFVGLHRLPTIESGIGPREDGLNAAG
jgi:hypothetical protein